MKNITILRNSNIVITGTTSGLGYTLLSQLYPIANQIICINRRKDLRIENKFSKALFCVLDISNPVSVANFVRSNLDNNKSTIFLLNAAIHPTDNFNGFHSMNFHEACSINLFGITNFIEPADACCFYGSQIVAIGSTAAIYGNTDKLGYMISKYAVHQLFAKCKPRGNITIKVVSLGPMKTKMSSYQKNNSLQTHLLNFLMLEPDAVAKKVIDFIGNPSKKLRLGITAHFFFWTLRILLFWR